MQTLSFLLPIPIDHSADYLICEDIRSSGSYFIYMELQNISGLCDDMTYSVSLKSKSYTFIIFVIIPKHSFIIQFIEEDC